MTLNPLKIVFMGTPDFACSALRALHEDSGHDIVCVYSQPPRPKGRGHQVQPSAVHEYADAQGIEVRHPKSLKSAEARAEFAALDADVAVVAAYGLILPQVVLDAPKYGCINIHASLLPRWRGASPIQRAIWAGDEESGVTLMQMDIGLDTGPEIMVRRTALGAETTAQSLHDDLAQMGASMIVEALDRLAADGALKSVAQDDTQTCYAPLLTKDDGKIDWAQDAAVIDRQIRALNPWPGTFCDIGDARLKVSAAVLGDGLEAKDQSVGMLLNRHGDVVCGAGSALRLQRVQPAGKKAMDITSAVNGGYLKVGDVLV